MAPASADALTPAARSERVKAAALELGFVRAGITDLSPTPHAEALDRWLKDGFAASMSYMHRQATRRKRPATIVDRAIRAVVVLYNYARETPEGSPDAGQVAAYGRGRDYHDGLRPALEALARTVAALGPADAVARPYVDAGPVPERELAQRAGLGWIGKNTMLIDPARGSFTFIASVITNVDLAVDRPFEADRCGTCTRCLEACPTDAFVAPRVLDARRCISYLTIEHRGPMPPDPAPHTSPWIFGCDVCQDVCPWNGKFLRTDEDRVLGLDPIRAWVPLDTFDEMDDRTFDADYGWTPLARPGLAGMRRNAAAARRPTGRDEA